VLDCLPAKEWFLERFYELSQHFSKEY